MLPDRISNPLNPGPLTYESGALPTGLRGPTSLLENGHCTGEKGMIQCFAMLKGARGNEHHGLLLLLIFTRDA